MFVSSFNQSETAWSEYFLIILINILLSEEFSPLNMNNEHATETNIGKYFGNPFFYVTIKIYNCNVMIYIFIYDFNCSKLINQMFLFKSENSTWDSDPMLKFLL